MGGLQDSLFAIPSCSRPTRPAVEDTGGPASTSSFATGPAPWTMLSADIQDNMAAQYQVQAEAAAINARMMETPASNGWAGIAFALKPGSAGAAAPAEIRVLRVEHIDPMGASPFGAEIPAAGNLLVASWIGTSGVEIVDTTSASSVVAGSQVVVPGSIAGIASGSILGIDVGGNYEVLTVSSVTATSFTTTFRKSHSGPFAICGITDNQSNPWQAAHPAQDNGTDGDGVQMFYAPNATASANSTGVLLNVAHGGVNSGVTLILYDVTGASTSPFDTATGAVGDNEEFTPTAGAAIPPSAPNELVFAEISVDNGSVTGVQSPGSFLSIGPTPDTADYPADENNGWLIYYDPNTSNYQSVWKSNEIIATWGSMAAAFKAADWSSPKSSWF
jgi:hypothetical protein